MVAGLLPSARPAPGHPRRLLLIRPDHLGDVLLASPAVAALRGALPEAHLTFMVGPWSEEVARRGAEVDEVLTCEFPGFTRGPKRSLLEPYSLLLREAVQLRGRYDLAIILRPDHWWGALLAALAGIPLRLGWDTPTTRRLLTDPLPLPPGKHAVALNLALAHYVETSSRSKGGETPPLRAYGETSTSLSAGTTGSGGRGGVSPPSSADATLQISARVPEPIFHLLPEERTWASEIAGESDRPLILLHPGSGSPLKNWPAGRWAQVADALAKAGARVALSGGQDDLASPTEIARAMKEPSLQLAGATTLGQLGALAERCTLAIGADNGPLHLAAAVGTPTVRLYGPTDEAMFGPWGANGKHTTLTNPLPCRPCGNLLAPPCAAVREPPCLLGLETDRVIAAALAQLSSVSG